MSPMASKTDDLIFVAGTYTNFDDDSHRHFVKLFVFICGDMNGVTPWLRAIFVSVYHKENAKTITNALMPQTKISTLD